MVAGRAVMPESSEGAPSGAEANVGALVGSICAAAWMMRSGRYVSLSHRHTDPPRLSD